VKRHTEPLGSGTFDLLVVGGGVYGAWTAYDAALRGLRVAIVERRDWASATSSNSSKLIHGGLRYLEFKKFGLVRKTLQERNRLRRLAPHRVHRLRFAIPLYFGGRLLRWKLRLGLIFYDSIARSERPLRGHEALSARRLAKRYDFLKKEGLQAGFTYGDCQTDDARFALELIAGALDAGAVAVNHATVLKLTEQDGAITGAVVEDGFDGETFQVRARMTALCAGAWNSHLLESAVPDARLETRNSKGVHLVLPPLPAHDGILLLTGERGRVAFLIPWNGRTLLGTTDTPYDGDPANVHCTPEDEEYLLDLANNAFQGFRWTRDDVIARFAGLRTFPSSAGDPSSLSREWSLAEPCDGVVASVGGKYTSARADAATLVTQVCKKLGHNAGPCPTTWRHFPWRPDGRYRSWQHRTLSTGLRLGLDEETTVACQLRYGSRVETLFGIIEKSPKLASRYVPEAPVCLGDLVYCTRHEMVGNLHDLLRRRLPLLLVASLPRRRVELAAAICGEILGWTEKRRAEEVATILDGRDSS